MGKPIDIPDDIWNAARAALIAAHRNPEADEDGVAIVARAITAERRRGWAEAKAGGAQIADSTIVELEMVRAEERERWQPAVTYFNAYCLDEEDDPRNCLEEAQHEAAKTFGRVVRGEAV